MDFPTLVSVSTLRLIWRRFIVQCGSEYFDTIFLTLALIVLKKSIVDCYQVKIIHSPFIPLVIYFSFDFPFRTLCHLIIVFCHRHQKSFITGGGFAATIQPTGLILFVCKANKLYLVSDAGQFKHLFQSIKILFSNHCEF